MRITLFLALLCSVLVACTNVYVYPAVRPTHAVRGSGSMFAQATVPSRALASTWVANPGRMYPSPSGRMLAVQTNDAIAGFMWFEDVPSSGKDVIAFVTAACADLKPGRDLHCGTALYGYEEPHAAELSFSLQSHGKDGVIVAVPSATQRGRMIKCTGAWFLYGDAHERQHQNRLSADRLRSYCRKYAGY